MSTGETPWIGIDVGTVRSSAAVLIGNEPKPVNLGTGYGALDMPTALFVEQDGLIRVGDEAVNTRVRDPRRYLDQFKLKLAAKGGATFTVHGERRNYPWPELVAAVLKRIRGTAERDFNNGAPLTRAVLTVPAIYAAGGPPWKVMEEAAKLAGFQEVRIVREPHAAAIYYDHIMRQSRTAADGIGKITLVYDLGGGTFDPALIRLRTEGYQMIAGIDAQEGVQCGGIYFDQKIREDFLEKCPGAMAALPDVRRTADGAVVPEDATKALQQSKALMRLDDFLVRVKHRFAHPDVQDVCEMDPIVEQFDYKITRREFYDKIEAKIDETIECCKTLVAHHDVHWRDVARILLVGGSCHIPLVREKLSQMVGDCGGGAEICWGRIGQSGPTIDPLLAVSLGAALSLAGQTVTGGNNGPAPSAMSEAETAANADSILALGRSAIAVLAPLAEADNALEETIQRSGKRITNTYEPFRLGVMGDARAGKSTLINCMAGEPLAFTDVIEATPVACVFRQGSERSAAIHYRDGSVERVTVEEANRRISENRHDVTWIGRVRFVEFMGTRGGLRDIELWDAPGFGGSDHNDATAAEFLGRIGGAIWVFDCQFLGVSTHIPPLQALKQSGKKVVAVVNKVDFLDAQELDEILDEAKQRYGEYVGAIAPLSAMEAFNKATAGEDDRNLVHLRGLVHRFIVSSSEADRRRRIVAATQHAGQEIAREISRRLRTLEDRLGFLAHIGENFGSARGRIVKVLPDLIKAESEREFSAMERRALDDLARFYATSTEAVVRVADVDQLLKGLYADSSLEEAYKGSAERVGNALRARWDSECLDAVLLSTAAVPNVLLGRPLDEIALAEVRRTVGAWGIGTASGTLSAIAIAVLAATTTVVAWPLVLASIPIGIFTGWKKYLRDAPPEVESMDSQQHRIKAFFQERRRELHAKLSENLPRILEELLEKEVQALEASWTSKILGGTPEDVTRKISDDLRAILASLREKLPREDMDDRLGARPLRIDTSRQGQFLWTALLARIDRRVDLVVPDLASPLIKFLQELRPEVLVRVVTTAARGESPDPQKAFGGWKGQLEARVVTRKDGSRVPLDSSLLVSDGLALRTPGSLCRAGQDDLEFHNYPNGVLAAEREFAELWQGKSTRYGALSVKPMACAATVRS